MLDIGILQKYWLKDVGVLKGEFGSLGVQMKFRQPAGLDFIVVTSYIHMVWSVMAITVLLSSDNLL